jgi:hypothetical protein
MRALLDLTDAAYYLDISTDTLRNMVRERTVPYIRRNNTLYFVVSDLDEWIRGLQVVNVEEALHTIQRPATFPVTSGPEPPRIDEECPRGRGVLPLRRGARRQVTAPAAQKHVR